MLTFLLEHKPLVFPGTYFAIGVFVFWFFGEMRRIDGEKTSLMYGGFSGKMFAVYKCVVVISGVVLWPFVLRNRWKNPRPPKPDDGRSLAGNQLERVETISKDWRVGQTLLDDFVVERELGEGGMGKVYLMKARTTNRRFAVKRAKGLSEHERRNFLAELQTWIDLPEHANLVPCRFFRTVGDEVLIFAEYVAGGSLRNWIDSQKLYEEGTQKTLERLLDTAIQFAWGLHCVHELGLVHQDVKPANVMIETDAQGLKIRLTDYGLARACAVGGQRTATNLNRNTLVSSGGFTPAYCSPEQAEGRKLDLRTDVWSWGVSVLEMFQGEVFWPSGRVAGKALAAFLEHNGEQKHIPAMPAQMAELLRDCFREEPAQRWQSFDGIVQKLKVVYQAAVGAEYGRALGKIDQTSVSHGAAPSRRTHQGLSWRDPQDWLKSALRAEGRDPAEAAKIMAKHANSTRGQLVADVAAYDEARRIFERVVKGGREDFTYDLSVLCMNAACVHETSDDFPGALALYDRGIELLEQLIKVGHRHELIGSLLSVYEQKANSLMKLGDNLGAIGLYDRAIGVHERWANVKDLANDLGDVYSIYNSKAVALMKLGDNRAAVALHDRSIEILERLVNFESRRELADGLANAYMNKAVAVANVGDKRAAVSLFDQAIEIVERLINLGGRRELESSLAKLYMNKASVVRDSGDNRAALRLFDRAIEILERLVTVDGRVELANDLAGLYMNKGIAMTNLREISGAVGLYDRAIEIREWLVNMEGRRDLAIGLAKLYVNKGNAIIDLGDRPAVVVLYDRAIEILQGLVQADGRQELANELAAVYTNKANLFMIAGDNRAAVAPYDQAIDILHRLVNVEGRRELAKSLATLYRNKGNALKNLGDNRAAVTLYTQAIGVLDRLVNVEDRRELVADISESRLKSIADDHRQKREALTGQLTESFANFLLGEKIPVDVMNAETGEIIIPTNRKITKTLLRKLAMVHDHIEIDPGPTCDKIREVIQSYTHRFAELEFERDMDCLKSGPELNSEMRFSSGAQATGFPVHANIRHG